MLSIVTLQAQKTHLNKNACFKADNIIQTAKTEFKGCKKTLFFQKIRLIYVLQEK